MIAWLLMKSRYNQISSDVRKNHLRWWKNHFCELTSFCCWLPPFPPRVAARPRSTALYRPWSLRRRSRCFVAARESPAASRGDTQRGGVMGIWWEYDGLNHDKPWLMYIHVGWMVYGLWCIPTKIGHITGIYREYQGYITATNNMF